VSYLNRDISPTLFIIGCGTPTPTPERFGSCLVLNIRNEYLMFDCGPATTHKLAKSGLKTTDINHLFFTHHHYDHNADYPCFLLCRWDHEKEGIPLLKVYGPSQTEQITQKLIGPDGAFADDWRARVEHPASQQVYAARGGKIPRPKPTFDVRDIEAGEHFKIGTAVVSVSQATHLQPILKSLAYRVDWEGQSIVITGDTGKTDEIKAFSRRAQTLVVNIWDFQENMTKAMTSGFCGTLDAALLAKESEAKRLIVTHQTPGLCKPGAREKAVSDMADIFKGEIIFGEELMVIHLN